MFQAAREMLAVQLIGAEARVKLEAETRAVNPRDQLRGAWAASSLYRQKRSSQRGLQHDAGEAVNRATRVGGC